jgi:hypothetical protein
MATRRVPGDDATAASLLPTFNRACLHTTLLLRRIILYSGGTRPQQLRLERDCFALVTVKGVIIVSSQEGLSDLFRPPPRFVGARGVRELSTCG